MNGLTYAIRAIVLNHRRHDGAVGRSCAFIGEVVIPFYIGIVGQQQRVILSGLGVVDIAVLVVGRVIARVHHVVATQVAHVLHAGERAPTNEVDVQVASAGSCSDDVYVQVASLAYMKIIKSGVGSRCYAVVIVSIFPRRISVVEISIRTVIVWWLARAA